MIKSHWIVFMTSLCSCFLFLSYQKKPEKPVSNPLFSDDDEDDSWWK